MCSLICSFCEWFSLERNFGNQYKKLFWKIVWMIENGRKNFQIFSRFSLVTIIFSVSCDYGISKSMRFFHDEFSNQENLIYFSFWWTRKSRKSIHKQQAIQNNIIFDMKENTIEITRNEDKVRLFSIYCFFLLLLYFTHSFPYILKKPPTLIL